MRATDLPDQLESAVHRNRLLKIAREGAQMTSRNLAKFEPERRHATLAAKVIETTATITCICWAFRFVPRIRDLPDKRLFVPRRPSSYPALKILIGAPLTPSAFEQNGTKRYAW